MKAVSGSEHAMLNVSLPVKGPRKTQLPSLTSVSFKSNPGNLSCYHLSWEKATFLFLINTKAATFYIWFGKDPRRKIPFKKSSLQRAVLLACMSRDKHFHGRVSSNEAKVFKNILKFLYTNLRKGLNFLLKCYGKGAKLSNQEGSMNYYRYYFVLEKWNLQDLREDVREMYQIGRWYRCCFSYR